MTVMTWAASKRLTLYHSRNYYHGDKVDAIIQA